jgi:hypothetical protein
VSRRVSGGWKRIETNEPDWDGFGAARRQLLGRIPGGWARVTATTWPASSVVTASPYSRSGCRPVLVSRPKPEHGVLPVDVTAAVTVVTV